MNKIIVSNGIVKSDNLNVLVDRNVIEFRESGTYQVEYLDNKNISLCFKIENKNIKLLESCFDSEIEVSNRYVINNGELCVNKFYNNKSVDENIIIDLCSEGAKIDYTFVNICKGIEKYNIDVNHKVKDTVSNINNKSINFKNSDISYIINSNVDKDSIGSILDQKTRIVTMGECNTKVEPNMFIDLDDVSANHGSVIGTFNKDMVFYLMSKGISYNDSLKLLVKGFLLSNIEVSLDVRTRIMDTIDMYWR